MHTVEIVRSEAGDGTDLGINDAHATGGHSIPDRPVVEALIECLGLAIEVTGAMVSVGAMVRWREVQEPPAHDDNESSDVL